MFGFVDAVGVDAEERVREPTVAKGGGVGEEEVDKEASKGVEDTEAEGAEALVDFEGSYDARQDDGLALDTDPIMKYCRARVGSG